MPPRRTVQPKKRCLCECNGSSSASASAAAGDVWIPQKSSGRSPSDNLIRHAAQKASIRDMIDQSIRELRSFQEHSAKRKALCQHVGSMLCPARYDPDRRAPIGIPGVCSVIYGYMVLDTAETWYLWSLTKELAAFKLREGMGDTAEENRWIDDHTWWLEMCLLTPVCLDVPDRFEVDYRLKSPITAEFVDMEYGTPSFTLWCTPVQEASVLRFFRIGFTLRAGAWVFSGRFARVEYANITSLLADLMCGSLAKCVPLTGATKQLITQASNERGKIRQCRVISSTEEVSVRVACYVACRVFIQRILVYLRSYRGTNYSQIADQTFGPYINAELTSAGHPVITD